jgi:hypothetical protein
MGVVELDGSGQAINTFNSTIEESFVRKRPHLNHYAVLAPGADHHSSAPAAYAADKGNYFAKGDALFVSDTVGKFRKSTKKKQYRRQYNPVEVFREGANAFFGVGWEQCEARTEYNHEMDKALGNEVFFMCRNPFFLRGLLCAVKIVFYPCKWPVAISLFWALQKKRLLTSHGGECSSRVESGGA